MKRLMVLFLFAAFLTVPAFAQAQQQQGSAQARYQCLPHADVVEKLENDFSEKVVGVGLGNRGQTVLELFVGKKGSWTVLVSLTNGWSCITAAGDNWTPMELDVEQQS